MTKAEHQRRKIRELLGRGGHATWADLRAAGVERRAVIGMVESGELERADHNLYRLAAHSAERYPHWAAIAAKYPSFVICLLSAAQHHGLTTQMPSQTWVGLPAGSKPSNPSVRCVQWPGPTSNRVWTVGVETVTDGPHSYRVTDPARTVVDLYRWRTRLPEGDRILAEALGEYDRRGLSRAALADVGHAFGVDEAISGLLVWKGHLEHAQSAF
jgi:predicted transcriptional regulator of viral defense system